MSIFSKLFKASWMFATWIVCRFVPIDNKKIVVVNYVGRGYGDNAKYIVDELLKSEKDVKIVWLVKNQAEADSLPDRVSACKIYSAASIYHLSTAKVWIDNCRKGFIMFKRRKQYYMQTWHGFALKRIEKDVADNLGKKYVHDAINDSKLIDCIISDSAFMTGIYKRAFWYDGEILELGSPRNDIIINKNAGLKEKVFEYFGIDRTRKLVLYAPTFRADYSNDAYSLDFHRLKHSCEQKFGGNFSVLVRLHPNIVKNCDQMNFDNVDVINASFYPDMQELLSVSDAVISDYSSLMFDFALSMKPCFQFATDIDEYKKDRDFYFEIDNLPFVLAKNNDELEQGILDFDEEKYKSELASFYESVGMVLDGTASSRCSEIILEKCYGKYPV